MIPIYKAECVNDNEYKTGNFIKTQDKYYIYQDGTSDIYMEDDDCFDDGSIDGEIRIIDLIFEVNIETMQISFDSGKSFIKLSDLEVHTCTDFKLEYTNMQMNTRKDVQPPNGSIFIIITDKGR